MKIFFYIYPIGKDDFEYRRLTLLKDGFSNQAIGKNLSRGLVKGLLKVIESTLAATQGLPIRKTKKSKKVTHAEINYTKKVIVLSPRLINKQ